MNKQQLSKNLNKMRYKLSIIESNYTKINLTLYSVFNLISTHNRLYTSIFTTYENDINKINQYESIYNILNNEVSTLIDKLFENYESINKPICIYKLPFIRNKFISVTENEVDNTTIYYKMISLGVNTINFMKDLYDNSTIMGIIKDENEYKRILSLFNNYLFTNYDTMNYKSDIKKYNNTILLAKDNIIKLYNSTNDEYNDIINCLLNPNNENIFIYLYAALLGLEYNNIINMDKDIADINDNFVNTMIEYNDKIDAIYKS